MGKILASSRPLAWIGLAFIIGIVLARFAGVPLLAWGIAALAFLVTPTLILRRKTNTSGSGTTPTTARDGRRQKALGFWGLFLLACVFLGAARYELEFLGDMASISAFVGNDPLEVILSGRVSSDPVFKETAYGSSGVFDLKVRRVKTTKWYEAGGTVQVKVYGRKEISYGDVLIARGELAGLPRARNPGQFDYGEYLQRRSISAVFTVKDPRDIISRGNAGSTFVRAAFALRHRVHSVLRKNLPGEEAGILGAMLLGTKEEVDYDLKDEFIKTGTVHILAISGLHTGIIAVFALCVLRVLGAGRTPSCVITVLILSFYAVLSGMRVPVVRSATMASVHLLGMAIKREPDIYNTLGLSAVLILVKQPLQCFDSGFQMSFLSVGSIALLAPAFTGTLAGFHAGSRKRAGMMLRRVFQSCAVSLSACAGLAPVIACYFNIFSPIAVIGNLMMIPLLSGALISGIVLAGAGLLSNGAAAIVKYLPYGFLYMIEQCARVFSKVPFGHFYVATPSWLQICLYYISIGILVLAIIRRLSLRKTAVMLLLPLNIFTWQKALQPVPEKLEILFFDVGYADAALFRFPGGGTMLVDTGNESPFNTGRYIIQPYLLRNGIKRIDAIVVTHSHSDHAGGAASLVSNLAVGCVIDNGFDLDSAHVSAYRSIASMKNTRVYEARAGDTITGFEGVSINVLNPESIPPTNAQVDMNNASVVLLIACGDTAVLTCGDLEAEGIKKMLDSGARVTASVIKVPHHGGKCGADGERFFETVGAKTAVVSAGTGKWKDLPSKATLGILNGRGSAVYLTSASGAVKIVADSGGLTVKEHLKR